MCVNIVVLDSSILRVLRLISFMTLCVYISGVFNM